MNILRQMVEKRLDVQGSMALGFVDLEISFDIVPREMVIATLRWMQVPEAEVRMVESTYEKTTARLEEYWWEKELRRSLRSRMDLGRAAC